MDFKICKSAFNILRKKGIINKGFKKTYAYSSDQIITYIEGNPKLKTDREELMRFKELLNQADDPLEAQERIREQYPDLKMILDQI